MCFTFGLLWLWAVRVFFSCWLRNTYVEWQKLVFIHGYLPKIICLKPRIASKSSDSHKSHRTSVSDARLQWCIQIKGSISNIFCRVESSLEYSVKSKTFTRYQNWVWWLALIPCGLLFWLSSVMLGKVVRYLMYNWNGILMLTLAVLIFYFRRAGKFQQCSQCEDFVPCTGILQDNRATQGMAHWHSSEDSLISNPCCCFPLNVFKSNLCRNEDADVSVTVFLLAGSTDVHGIWGFSPEPRVVQSLFQMCSCWVSFWSLISDTVVHHGRVM